MEAKRKNERKKIQHKESNKVISRTSNFKKVFHLDNGKSPFGKSKMTHKYTLHFTHTNSYEM